MRYYIFNLERLMFWKPGGRGYTRDYLEAGLYSDEKSKEIVFDRYCKKKKNMRIREDEINKLLVKK